MLLWRAAEDETHRDPSQLCRAYSDYVLMSGGGCYVLVPQILPIKGLRSLHISRNYPLESETGPNRSLTLRQPSGSAAALRHFARQPPIAELQLIVSWTWKASGAPSSGST